MTKEIEPLIENFDEFSTEKLITHFYTKTCCFSLLIIIYT